MQRARYVIKRLCMLYRYIHKWAISREVLDKRTLNDHRTASGGRPPVIGPATLEPSRVGQEGPKQEDSGEPEYDMV